MKARQTRGKTIPYRILVYLLYGSYGWLKTAGREIEVGPSSLARTLKVSKSRVREYFEWLQRFGFVQNVRFERGKIQATLVQPPRFQA